MPLDLVVLYSTCFSLRRSVKSDSATSSYVQRLSRAFFGCVRETAVGFDKAFDGGESKAKGASAAAAVGGAMLTWMDQEVDRFCFRIEKQVRRGPLGKMRLGNRSPIVQES